MIQMQEQVAKVSEENQKKEQQMKLIYQNLQKQGHSQVFENEVMRSIN